MLKALLNKLYPPITDGGKAYRNVSPFGFAILLLVIWSAIGGIQSNAPDFSVVAENVFSFIGDFFNAVTSAINNAYLKAPILEDATFHFIVEPIHWIHFKAFSSFVSTCVGLLLTNIACIYTERRGYPKPVQEIAAILDVLTFSCLWHILFHHFRISNEVGYVGGIFIGFLLAALLLFARATDWLTNFDDPAERCSDQNSKNEVQP